VGVTARKESERKNTGFDFERAIAAHLEATQKAGAWGKKVKGLRAAGMSAAADAAERKANYWLRKATALAVLAEHGRAARARIKGDGGSAN
jgi:hypothetical protein